MSNLGKFAKTATKQSRCAICPRPIRVGDPILMWGKKKKFKVHKNCPSGSSGNSGGSPKFNKKTRPRKAPHNRAKNWNSK